MSIDKPYPGYMSVREMFPDWDWDAFPLGPPLDDPNVKARTAIQWRQFLKDAKKRRE